MSTRQLLACQYCGRKNFKSQVGLKKHQLYSNECLLRQSTGIRQPLGNLHVNKCPKFTIANQLDALHDDNSNIDSITNAMSSVQIIDQQDDQSWGIGAGDDDDNNAEEATEANKHLHQFRQYVEDVRNNFREFDRYEVASLELMHLLMKKGASLETYDAVMQWHMDVTGDRNPSHFHSRHKMMGKLRTRYNLPKEYLKEKHITLPHSGAHCKLVYHDARDAIVSLLTDPRLADDDFLHFDDNPLAPPPDDLDYLADINTGESYIKTYQQLITNPNKQILLPIILYIDGAVTGQFDKLQVEAMKLTLGILKRKAREKQHAWREIGTLRHYVLPNLPVSANK